MDAVPPDWNKTCEAAKQLRQDLVDGFIDARNYKPKTVHKMRAPLFTQYSLHRFSNNLRNVVSGYQAAKALGEEALQTWLKEGAIPSSSGKWLQ
jgi:hypothetical protein